MSTTTAPLDSLIDAGHGGLAGKVAAAALHGRRSAITTTQRELIETHVPAGTVRFFRDGAETWIERND